jgi:hypothetical protein
MRDRIERIPQTIARRRERAERGAVTSHDERNGVGATELKAFRVEVFAARNDISRSQAFKEIAAGRLVALKVGSRTIITVEAERAWRRALPKAVPTDAAAKTERPRPEPPSRRPSRPQKLPAQDSPRVVMAEAKHEKRHRTLRDE